MNPDVRYRWKLLDTGPLWIDGGGMFGIIPRVLWTRLTQPDEKNRIHLAQNCLLLHRADGAGKPILIETGSGDKFDAKSKAIYGLTDRTVIDALAEADCPCETIGDVILTHLHFDHAGGLTRKAASGIAPAFPDATIHVQRREWEDALINRSTMRRTYLPENLHPVREQLRLIDSPPPFTAGYLPKKDELPPSTVASRESMILPGITGFLVPGHTWGQQAIKFTDDRGRLIVFTPDVLPTANHVGPTYNLGYDVEPYTSTISRRWLLKEAVEKNYFLLLNHEVHHPLQRAQDDGEGWYRLKPEELS